MKENVSDEDHDWNIYIYINNGKDNSQRKADERLEGRRSAVLHNQQPYGS